MIKDFNLRLLFIPFLGIVISYISGIISYEKYPAIGNVANVFYFVLVSLCIWKGSQWIHLKFRRFYAIDINPLTKISSLCLVTSIYGAAVACALCLIWIKISYEIFSWIPIIKATVFSVMAVILFTLVYEVLYLSKERERDNIIVDQLDHELTRAEVAALRNELDPHFIFNSLNTLSYLITKNSAKADMFNNKLAQVYKYFLINKNKEQISLEKEIEFITNYIFLIQIRHENKLQLNIELKKQDLDDVLVIPYSLQLLVENAIKHNEFTTRQPLQIFISMDDDYLNVQNSVRKRNVINNSTNIGLRNLSTQYLLIFKKNIVIEKLEKNFLVKLPLIKKT